MIQWPRVYCNKRQSACKIDTPTSRQTFARPAAREMMLIQPGCPSLGSSPSQHPNCPRRLKLFSSLLILALTHNKKHLNKLKSSVGMADAVGL
jgi:hypothetical protein